MSKKDRKIKALKREVKALRAELRRLKSVNGRRTTVAKARKPDPEQGPKPRPQPKPKPKPKSSAQTPPARTGFDTPPLMAMALKSISAVRGPGRG
jgi:hypothetical protein